ncbi:MAG: metal-dependent hydrolase [Thermoguttaceae bacterium]|nr:metal-dependent hydrolase [Thermoguttaceae bacterium]
MTPPEHGLVGFSAAIALGLYKRGGWKLVALTTFVAMVPDWDWLACLWGDAAFQTIHRVWGHAIISCLLTAFVVASCDYWLDITGRCGQVLHGVLSKCFRFFGFFGFSGSSGVVIRQQRNWSEYRTWVIAATIIIFTHPIADLLVTGGVDFPPWPVQLFWPFSPQPFTCPILHWGDPGILTIFILGLVAMCCLRKYCRFVAFSVFIVFGLYAWLR